MEWTGARYADNPTVAVSIEVAASPRAVWALISDIDLVADLSSELQRVEWLDGAASATLGARFRGHNLHPAMGEWSTTCTVIECDPGRAFAWVVEDVDNPTATWRFSVEGDEHACVVTQWARMGPGPSGLTYAIEAMPDAEQKIVFVRMREWERAMTVNLAGIKARAEQA